MRGAVRSLRRGFELPARPPWGYGLLCAVAISFPLIVGALAKELQAGGLVALGAYLTAFGDLYGQPYGKRARKLALQVVLIAAGFLLGSFLAPYPWWAVGVVGLVAAAAGQWRMMGTPPVLATVVGFYLVPPAGGQGALLMALGGVEFCVLALALWPVRRLDPLKAALNEAVESMAGMLEGLDLPEEDWAERRERGSLALEDAATASAAYQGGEQADRSPDAFVQTLVRIFHESVALRVLRAQAGHEKAEIDKVVAALSSALRQAAEGSVAGVEGALSATADFGERISRLRARKLADPDSLRTIARLGQVRRCLDRIVVAVRTIGRFAAEGVSAHARLPSFTWQLQAGYAPEHAGRLGIAVGVAMALVVGTHEHYGKWFVFTVLLALRSTYGDTVDRVVLRVAGTVVGGGIAALVLAAVPSNFTVAALVLVFGTLGFALREVSYGYWSVFATPLALMLTDFSIRLDWAAAAVRLWLTVAGGLLALVAARVLWPYGEAGRIRGLIVDLLREHAAVVRTLAERDVDAMPARTEAAGQAADELSESLDRLEKEPGGRVPEELRTAVTSARKLRDDAILMAAVMRGAEEGSDATTAVLDGVADRLTATARAVRDDRTLPELDDFGAGLDEVASHVDSLMEEAAEIAPSAVRRQLRHAVAAHPALRTLSADAFDLARSVSCR